MFSFKTSFNFNIISNLAVVLLASLLCLFHFVHSATGILLLVCILQSMTLEEPMYVHPSSVLYHMNKEFIVYQSVEEISSRIYMKGTTVHLFSFSIVLLNNYEVKDVMGCATITGCYIFRHHDN